MTPAGGSGSASNARTRARGVAHARTDEDPVAGPDQAGSLVGGQRPLTESGHDK